MLFDDDNNTKQLTKVCSASTSSPPGGQGSGRLAWFIGSLRMKKESIIWKSLAGVTFGAVRVFITVGYLLTYSLQ
jgi:hypothetical protein